jgi:cysteine desulfurase
MTYLDHAATTPMLPEAVAAMSEALSTLGNASSLHGSGRRARRTVEECRESIAESLGARPSEVVFTAGGTEGDNLAVKGLFWERRAADPRRTRVLASTVEHHAVLDAVAWLADHEGAEVTWLEVDAEGRVHPDTLRAALDQDPASVALVTTMWANNEVGTVAPVRELAEVAAEYEVPLHTDAVQAVGQLPVHFGSSAAAAMTMTGHKLGGPYGAGALLLGRAVGATPLLHGGGQERDVRSGTLDVPSIVGLATAIRHAVQSQPQSAVRLSRLRDDLVAGILDRLPDAVFNGDCGDGVIDGGPSRLPGNAHLTFPHCEGDSLLMLLDARGIECSTGAACTAGVAQPSHVLLAMGASPAAARGSLRFSFGHTSTSADVAEVLDAIEPVVTRARGAGSRRPRVSSKSVSPSRVAAESVSSEPVS